MRFIDFCTIFAFRYIKPNANILIILLKPMKKQANKIISRIEHFINKGYFARLVLALNTAFLIVVAVIKVYHL